MQLGLKCLLQIVTMLGFSETLGSVLDKTRCLRNKSKIALNNTNQLITVLSEATNLCSNKVFIILKS